MSNSAAKMHLLLCIGAQWKHHESLIWLSFMLPTTNQSWGASECEKQTARRGEGVSIKTVNVWHPANRPVEQHTTDLCVCVWLNIYANYTHKAHNHRCRIPNTCIMDGQTIISVPFLASCVFMRQRCITFICTDTQVIRSLWMLEMTPGALDSFHVAGAELQSAHKPEQINSRQGLAEVSAANRFLIWFERDKNPWIKPAWRKKKGRPAYSQSSQCFAFFLLWSVLSLSKIKKQTLLPKINLGRN